MHTALIVLGIYVTGFIVTWILDAYVGLGNDDEKPESRVPTGLMCALWPFIWLIGPICMFADHLTKVKKKRIVRDQQKERLRIVAEKEVEKQRIEEEKLMQQVEAELENETKDSHAA